MSGAANPHLVTLRARVDAHFEAAVVRTPAAFECRAGCDRCCQVRISVFEVEAAPIREALAELAWRDPELRAQVRAQGRDPEARACALLVEGRCAVYEQRPLICRSHGLPIAVPAEPAEPDPEAAFEASAEAATPGPLRVDHCPLNFREIAPPRPSILVLDAVNRPLAVLAELTDPGASRVALAALAAAGEPVQR